MKIIKIKQGKPVDDPIYCGVKSLSEIVSEKISEHSLHNLLNKNSETYDVILDNSINENFFIGIDGLSWRDVLDNEIADALLYDLQIKKVCYRIEKQAENVYCLKTNGIVTLIFDFEEVVDHAQKPYKETDLMTPLNDGRKMIDYVIGGEFYQCIMCTRDMYECLVKEVLGDSWSEDYSRILNEYYHNHEEKKINVEFSNFYVFVQSKKEYIDNKKGIGVSKHIEDMCSMLRSFRNVNAHNLGELVEKNKESLVNAVYNMSSIARALQNAPVEKFLSIKAKRIEELKEMRD